MSYTFLREPQRAMLSGANRTFKCYKGRKEGEEKKLFCLVLKYSDQDQVGLY